MRPGPYLFQEQPALLYGIFFSRLLANVLFLVVGVAGAKIFARISLVPKTFLRPAVLALSVVGAYGVEQSTVDVWVMLVAGLVGYVLTRNGFGPAPITMGLVLGGLVERSLAQAMILFDHDRTGFLERPVALAFFVLAAGSILVAPLRVRAKINAIKPHPSGSLTHPGMTKMLELLLEHDLRSDDVERGDVGTNHNMPNALIHHHPKTELQAKFSMEFCMASVAAG